MYKTERIFLKSIIHLRSLALPDSLMWTDQMPQLAHDEPRNPSARVIQHGHEESKSARL